METRKRQRSVYVTSKQKKKLIELMVKHPELISCKVTQDFNYRDSQRLWHSIAHECNSIPGARKTWRQWRKLDVPNEHKSCEICHNGKGKHCEKTFTHERTQHCSSLIDNSLYYSHSERRPVPSCGRFNKQAKMTWQDIRSNTKRQQVLTNGELPPSLTTLTLAEQEALGLKKNSISSACHESPEFIPLEQDNVHVEENYNSNIGSNASFSETESPPEVKVFTHSRVHKMAKLKSRKANSSKHANNCIFNCDVLAVQEQRKIQLKEDYLNFKKDYLRQKLLLIKEQTEALKNIAKELSK